MLIAEYDTDIAVQREEEREIAFAEGEAQGIERGIAQGFSAGISRGRSGGIHQKALETAKAMKIEGFASGLIAKITGLDEETIKAL